MELSAKIDTEIAPRPREPLVQINRRVGVACGIGSVHRAIDHVEVRIAVIVGGVAQNVVRFLVSRLAQEAIFQSD
jgi:hypothetical protein